MITLFSVSTFWSLVFVAAELEMPFGDDLNDLPVSLMQLRMNRGLKALLNAAQQREVTYTFNASTQESMPTMKCPAGLITEETCEYTMLVEEHIYQAYGRMPPTPKKMICPKKIPNVKASYLPVLRPDAADSKQNVLLENVCLSYKLFHCFDVF